MTMLVDNEAYLRKRARRTGFPVDFLDYTVGLADQELEWQYQVNEEFLARRQLRRDLKALIEPLKQTTYDVYLDNVESYQDVKSILSDSVFSIDANDSEPVNLNEVSSSVSGHSGNDRQAPIAQHASAKMKDVVGSSSERAPLLNADIESLKEQTKEDQSRCLQQWLKTTATAFEVFQARPTSTVSPARPTRTFDSTKLFVTDSDDLVVSIDDDLTTLTDSSPRGPITEQEQGLPAAASVSSAGDDLEKMSKMLRQLATHAGQPPKDVSNATTSFVFDLPIRPRIREVSHSDKGPTSMVSLHATPEEPTSIPSSPQTNSFVFDLPIRPHIRKEISSDDGKALNKSHEPQPGANFFARHGIHPGGNNRRLSRPQWTRRLSLPTDFPDINQLLPVELDPHTKLVIERERLEAKGRTMKRQIQAEQKRKTGSSRPPLVLASGGTGPNISVTSDEGRNTISMLKEYLSMPAEWTPSQMYAYMTRHPHLLWRQMRSDKGTMLPKHAQRRKVWTAALRYGTRLSDDQMVSNGICYEAWQSIDWVSATNMPSEFSDDSSSDSSSDPLSDTPDSSDEKEEGDELELDVVWRREASEEQGAPDSSNTWIRLGETSMTDEPAEIPIDEHQYPGYPQQGHFSYSEYSLPCFGSADSISDSPMSPSPCHHSSAEGAHCLAMIKYYLGLLPDLSASHVMAWLKQTPAILRGIEDCSIETAERLPRDNRYISGPPPTIAESRLLARQELRAAVLGIDWIQLEDEGEASFRENDTAEHTNPGGDPIEDFDGTDLVGLGLGLVMACESEIASNGNVHLTSTTVETALDGLESFDDIDFYYEGLPDGSARPAEDASLELEVELMILSVAALFPLPPSPCLLQTGDDLAGTSLSSPTNVDAASIPLPLSPDSCSGEGHAIDEHSPERAAIMVRMDAASIPLPLSP